MRGFKEQAAKLRRWIGQSERTVFLGGAGVSTDSGLADFRSPGTGLYRQPTPFGCPPERVLSHSFYREHPEEFFNFYRTRLLRLEAMPNSVHYALADMERQGKLSAVITQNADNLHRRAGSSRVIDLHGNVYRNHCEYCGKEHTVERVAYCRGIPRCGCGGVIRPGILLFDETPEPRAVWDAAAELRKCSLLIIGGTSLMVSSAPRLLQCFRGEHMVILNDSDTPFDGRADMVIRGRLGDIFRAVWPLDMAIPSFQGILTGQTPHQ